MSLRKFQMFRLLYFKLNLKVEGFTGRSLKDSLEDLQYLRKLIREYTKKIYMIKTST